MVAQIEFFFSKIFIREFNYLLQLYNMACLFFFLVLWLYAGLLNLAPNSKEAQVFEQYAKQAAAQGTVPGGTGQFHHRSPTCFNFPPIFFVSLLA